MAPQAVREGEHKKDAHLEPNNRTTSTQHMQCDPHFDAGKRSW
jgi:hypothetical protein